MGDPPLPSIQCSTGPLWSFELEDALDLIAEAGFSKIELMVTRDPKTQEPKLPLKLAAERGLEIGAVHAPFLLLTRTVWGLGAIAKIERGLALCSAVGAPTLVVHPPYLYERRYARWIREELADAAARSGLAVGVETMFPVAVAGRRLSGYRWIKPEALVTSAPQIVLDTSHVAVSGFDIVNTLKLFGTQLVHIHLSDNAGDGKDGHLEIGRGSLPLNRLFEAVRATGYRGGVSLELSMAHHAGSRDDVVAALERNRIRLEAGLTGEVSRVQRRARP